MLEPCLGTMVKGRLEGGHLYTPAYVARVRAMVQGAARDITVMSTFVVLWGLLQQLILEMDGACGEAVEGSFFQSLFTGLMKGGICCRSKGISGFILLTELFYQL